MDKKVFISHSQKDKKIADIICSALEAENIGCWIAPRDIPYGNDWAGEITSAIENSELFVFILSESSNSSRQCPKEISIADNANKPIICIKIDDTEMNPGFRYHLSMQQTFFLDISIVDKKLVSVVEAVQEKLLKKRANITDSDYAYNVDEELDELFHRLFEKRTDTDEEPVSKAKAKLGEIQEKRFFSDFLERMPSPSSEKSNNKDEIFYGDKYEYGKNSLNYSNETKEYLTGKHFSIPVLPGMKMVAFQICEDLVDYRTLTKYGAFKTLDYIIEEELKKYTVYVDGDHSEGVSLLILYIDFDKGRIFVNTALLLNDTVKICKKPILMNFTAEQSFGSQTASLNDSYIKIADIEVSKDELVKMEEHWVSADIKLSPAIVLDVETALPVPREIYYDEKDNCEKSRMKLHQNRSYFAMQLNVSGAETQSTPLSELEKGKYYRKGYHGFPRALFTAIDCLEADGSPEAMYEIALIFDREDDCRDKDTYFEYLLNSANSGCEKALIELVLTTLFVDTDEKSLEEWREKLCDSLDEQSGVGNFVMGYVLEHQHNERAFDYYLKSAQNDYRPALLRLQCQSDEIESLSKDDIYIRYTLATEKHPGLSDYCMGKIYYYGIDIEPRKRVAVKLLKNAADAGDIDAQYSFFEIYNSDNVLHGKEIALMWLEKVAESSKSAYVELANWYIDGIGCKQSSENDEKAFALLKSLEGTNNKSAINNLAWLYKNGRGCSLDYVRARELFERAAELGCSTSYYHLGTLYENGFGVDRNIPKAIELYQIASQKGDKKAEEKLNALDIANN